MEFRGQADQGQMASPLDLQVPVIETLEEHERNEEGEDEVEDGCGFMPEAVIEGPMRDKGMEQIVFDLPPSMSDAPEQRGGDLRHGKGGHPPPVMDLGLLDPLVVLTLPHAHRFLRAEHPEGSLNALSRAKAFRIPGADLASIFFPKLRFHQREHALGILKQHPLFPLEHGDNVFVMLPTEVDKGGFHIQGIGQHHIKETSLATHRSFQQSFGRNDLPLSGLQHLHVQRHRHLEPE